MSPPPQSLVEKYRTRAPRYTSYPTAPWFHNVQPAQVHQALASGQGALSAYVHIPFCKSLCSYCGCHVEIRGSNRELGAAYVSTVLAELALVNNHLNAHRPLAQLALGGGTPTFLLPADMARLIEGVYARHARGDRADISIEIDPRTVSDDYLDTLVSLGFNRFSLGVQDFDANVLGAVNRPQPQHVVENVVNRIRKHGSFNLNFDLMYGLPHQDEARFAATIDEMLRIRPTRVALFHYAHVPWMKPAQKLVEREGLPSSHLKAALFTLAQSKFAEAGYAQIGMDHFALPGDDLVAASKNGSLQRNFMGYTTQGGLDQIGLGVSAIGSFGGMYAQDRKDRTAWTAQIEAGQLPIERGFVLSNEDLARRSIIMDLFCNFQAEFSPADYPSEWAKQGELESDGLVVRKANGLLVTPLGRHFIRNVCAVFDAYLEADASSRRYSATA